MNISIAKLHLAKDSWGGIPAWPEWLRKSQSRPETNRLTFFTWKLWNKDDALLPSGLLGPVTLNAAEFVEIE